MRAGQEQNQFWVRALCKHTAAFVPAARRKRTQRPAQLNAKNGLPGAARMSRGFNTSMLDAVAARQRRDVAVVAALGLERFGRVRRRRAADPCPRRRGGASRPPARPRTASRPAIDMARRQDMLDAAFPRRRRPSATPAPPRRRPRRRRRRPSARRRRRRRAAAAAAAQAETAAAAASQKKRGLGAQPARAHPHEAAATAAAKPHRQPLGVRERARGAEARP